MNCQRCFYMDRRRGIGRPPGFPFNLNIAVDTLLKREFDRHRVDQTHHPLLMANGVDALPYLHLKMDTWRNNFKGVRFHHRVTNLIIFGAVDDVWVNPEGELIVVDYKATSKAGDVSIHARWQAGYRRQIEVYQWLLRQNGFVVSRNGYFVYCNGKTDRHRFDGKLEFNTKLIPYRGNDDWIEPTLESIYECLQSETAPQSSPDCEYCAYAQRLNNDGPASPRHQMKLV